MGDSSSAAAMPIPFDHTDPAFVADPYPTFHELRSRSPVHPHRGLGVRVVVSHALSQGVLRHRQLRRVWSDAQPAEAFPEFNELHRLNMLSNSEEHDRLRGALSALFSPPQVRRVRALVRTVAHEHISRLRTVLAEEGSACFVRHVASSLPVDVIGRLLGFPAADLAQLRDWSNAIVKMYEYGISQSTRAAAERAAGDMTRYVRDLAQHRRQHPQHDDVLSELVAAVDRGDTALTGPELISNYILLLMAGHEASVNALGNAVVALHDHPDQWRLLRADLVDDPLRMEVAADELLRYDTPNQLFERTAVAAVTVEGQDIAEGERIAVLLGAANRDPEAFADPDRLDLTRTPNRHLALGAGAHYCLGAPLARLELACTLDVLATELPAFGLAADPVRRPEFVIRGFSTVELTNDE